MDKLKRIENPRSVTLENITPEAQQYVDFLKDKHKTQLAKFPKLNTTWGILRFLRAWDFNINQADKMLKDALVFFDGLNYERIRTKSFPKELRNYYVRGFFNVSREGHPVLIERIALSNPKKCFELMNDEDIKDFFMRDLSFIYNIMLPICSERMGKRIDWIDIIFDLKDVNVLTFFDSNIKKLIGMTSQITQDYYPEGLNRALIINANLFFSGIWSIVKPFIDKETLNWFGLYKKDY